MDFIQIRSNFLFQTIKKQKDGGPAEYEPASHSGSGWPRTVIRPLLRARSSRCSVKPASRITLLFSNRLTQAFARTRRITRQLGPGSPETCQTRTDRGSEPVFHHLIVPTWVTSSSYLARRSVDASFSYINKYDLGTLQLTSDYVPGYGVSDSRRRFLKSSVSRRTLTVSSCSSCLVHKLGVGNGHLKSAINKASFVCRASSSGHRRNNPDFSRNNNKHGFRGRNRRNEDRDGLVDGNALEDSEILSYKNGPMFSLSNSPKFQGASSSPGPREKEIVDLFRKVQAQLRARAAAKKEDKKVEEASKGQGGKESETVDSLLKLLRKHSGEQSKKRDSNVSSEKQQLHGDDDDDVAERQDHGSNHFDSRNKDQNAVPFTRPASSFRRNSPVPRHKSQSSYFSEADAVYDEASSYSVTWTQKKDQVVSRDEPEYEPELEPESEPTLAILETESELKPESFYQEESEEDHEVALDELSEDDESLVVEEETAKDEDLSALKLIELRAIAKARGLKGISKMKKAELVDLLNKG
ncbi:unnamed protein product [Microthlaspi erraticum]|uniref:Rho termination factor-like N-terminal domain-containing protein n=1 Tax=Microthlaspi erraticum TaxID=1685480 RepID=A0A6D2KB05_9BRAS|nr:unnamed protein product [Microthlaspi erraticum]